MKKRKTSTPQHYGMFVSSFLSLSLTLFFFSSFNKLFLLEPSFTHEQITSHNRYHSYICNISIIIIINIHHIRHLPDFCHHCMARDPYCGTLKAIDKSSVKNELSPISASLFKQIRNFQRKLNNLKFF